MEEQYVILTGSKNNAGDYLIKYRAKQLLGGLRPDRKIIDYDAWLPFTPQQLEEVNRSKALILMGGPSLRPDMREVYPMVPDLDKIKVPILTMGVGWKSMKRDWDGVQEYSFSLRAMELLRRIDQSGYQSSVRDYHTMGVLEKEKLQNFTMTGCPALYSLQHLHQPFTFSGSLQHISYSLGVSFVESPEMELSMKENILSLAGLFKDRDFKVVFHHSLDKRYYDSPKLLLFHEKHMAMKNWLEENGVKYIEISGSAEQLIDQYRQCDLHIGYRVHAHIFMCSESRPSVLLCEDGRGTALREVISGLIFDAYKLDSDYVKLAEPGKSILVKTLNKIYKGMVPAYKKGVFMKNIKSLNNTLTDHLAYESRIGFPRAMVARAAIDSHFNQMKKFIQQLP